MSRKQVVRVNIPVDITFDMLSPEILRGLVSMGSAENLAELVKSIIMRHLQPGMDTLNDGGTYVVSKFVYENDPSRPEAWEGVGEGWHPILERLHEQLTECLGTYSLVQCKEKFGGLRYYIDFHGEPSKETVDKAIEIILKAEKESLRVCETCGAEGSLGSGTSRGWLKTLCAPCRESQ